VNLAKICQRIYRRRPDQPPPLDLVAVCADDQLIEAIRHGDTDHALTIADRAFVDLLIDLADQGALR
jgi:CHASE2 domain-containing sensor protein